MWSSTHTLSSCLQIVISFYKKWNFKGHIVTQMGSRFSASQIPYVENIKAQNSKDVNKK
jgi:hypothetical protein